MIYLRLTLLVVLGALGSSAFCKTPVTIFIEAESFSNRGDWVAPWKVEGAPGKFQLLAEENISLFLNTHVLRAEKEGATYS